MATHFLDLDFRAPAKDFPGSPSAQIYVKNNYRDDDFDFPIISAKCVSFEDVDEQIKRLEEELEALRRKAKRKFR